MNIYVPGKGQLNPKILLLGEAPSYKEEEKLEPFVGPSGYFLDACLREAGLDRSNMWLTNVSKYMVPPNPKKGKKIPFSIRCSNAGIDLSKQIDDLQFEIAQVKPNIILALGNTALYYTTGKEGITDWRGSILSGMNSIKTIPSYHPAHILHQDGEAKGYWTRTVLVHDLKRAKEESNDPVINLPQRSLYVARGVSNFDSFITRFRNHIRPAIDIEAHKCVPICVGIAFTPDEGITIPLWNVEGISELQDAELKFLWKMLADFLANQDVVGQNFGYDRDKILRLGFTVRSLASDTMLKSFALHPELPKNLAFNVSIYTREPFYKNEGMYEGTMHDLLIGCARDACVTKEVDLVLDSQIDHLGTRDYYEKFLLPLHDVYARMEQYGFRIDIEQQKRIINKYIEWDEKLEYELFQLTGKQFNAGSWQQVAKLLYDEWKIPARQGTGEEDLTAILNGNTVKDEKKRQTISTILTKRRVKKTIDTYAYARADFDGRMRTSYFLCLETGRSSSNQQEAPIRPTIEYRDSEKKKKKQAYGMAFQTITKHGEIGPDIRTIFIPDDGEIFLQADSSQAEARVIFLLAEDYQALKDIDEHDYHALTASWFFGGTENDYSKKVLGYESPYRFGGKTLRHAGHLGAGARRAATEVNTLARKHNIDFKISEAIAKHALETFHRRQPKIKQVFQASIIKCLEVNRRLSAPVPVGIDAKLGGTRTFFERWGDELFRQAFSYIPQRTVSENTKSAATLIHNEYKWIKILVEAHDSLLVSVPIDRRFEAALILKSALERPIDFSKCSLPRGQLVIPCEVEEGYNYKDLSKFKWMVT